MAMTVARPARASKAVVWMALISVIKILFNYNFRIFNIRQTKSIDQFIVHKLAYKFSDVLAFPLRSHMTYSMNCSECE
jgi:hypothetical protein